MNLRVLLVLSLLTVNGWSQATVNPAQREEADQERRKLLRAADTLDSLQSRTEAQIQVIETLQNDIAKLQAEINGMKDEFAKIEQSRAKERQAIIDEVTSLLAAQKSKVEPPKPEVPKTTPTIPPPAPAAEAYEHIVEKGETLYIIAKAYAEHGVKVTVADLRKANHLGPNEPIKSGQKIYIPRQ